MVENAKKPHHKSKEFKAAVDSLTDGKSIYADNILQSVETLELCIQRIEYLEEQAETRNRTQQGDHGPCRREIERLTHELEQERSSRAVLISKKNAEISYFKAELDGLLSEIANTATSVGSSPPKSVQSAYKSD